MRIVKFRIENFRNLRLAESKDPPDFMVICGGNGCGKSAVLQALITAKEHAGSYGGFQFDPRAVSVDADVARISMTLQFDETERSWVKNQHKEYTENCPEFDDISIEIKRTGEATALKRSIPTHWLLSYYSRQYQGSPGFFDYIDPYRFPARRELSSWNSEAISDDTFKQTLSAPGSRKFAFTKEYLASLKMGDLQRLQTAQRTGVSDPIDSLKPIRDFFDEFFAPLKFIDVEIDSSPFRYIIRTPRGDIDIDDMSSGEKEVLNTFIRFHQLQPRGAVILFDEADVHLHPDLERRYLEVLKKLGKGNQLWLTTHSPEMMIAAGHESLYTVLRNPVAQGGNQFVRVSDSQSLHDALSEVMGSRGLVSFNQRIIFIEGEESSVDREIYEKFYPPSVCNVSFVPAGNSGTVRKTAERVNELLSSAIEFQHYFCIVDGDIERSVAPPVGGRLYRLSVYHVENYLLDEDIIFEVTRAMLGSQCPYANATQVSEELQQLLMSDNHLKPYTRALLDARIAKLAKEAWDEVYASGAVSSSSRTKPDFASVMTDAEQIMRQAVLDKTWKSKAKGRDLLKAFCAKRGLKYDHFQNLVVERMKQPPTELQVIMDEILNK
jgi:predicted ATPase